MRPSIKVFCPGSWARAIFALVLCILPLHTVHAATPAETVWRLLDYIAVDYPGAVENGRIISALEYKEMVEFSAAVQERVKVLPGIATHPDLLRRASELESAVAAKAAPTTVADQAHAFAAALLAAYPVPLAPQSLPDTARGAALYKEHCVACHGITGAGDGPAARELKPPPIAFTDRSRADQRSLFSFYQVIGQGLEDTAMASFAALPDSDRWALAFHVGRLAYDRTSVERGEQVWRRDARAHAAFPNLAALTRATPEAVAHTFGRDSATDIVAYLRHNPKAVLAAPSASLILARSNVEAAVAAYQRADFAAATDLALSAYLDGIEPVEPAIAAQNRTLLVRIETAMASFRSHISQRAPLSDVQAQAGAAQKLFDEAEESLNAAGTDKASAFVGAFTVLLREGLEAILIVVAMIAFLRKAGREDVLVYVHGGWLAALGAGVVTWAAATYLITISGASRELTEGIGAIFAAAVLISVGIWMHGKSQADAWQRYIREKLAHALSRKSLWFLFLLTFVVVYREVFETILFYTALWTAETFVAVLVGAGAAVIALGIIAWQLLRYSRKLPIGRFFAASAALVAILAVVLTGKGIAALQEAGWIDQWLLPAVPRIEMLGIYGTLETIAAQAFVVLILVAGFLWNRRSTGL